MSAPMSDKSYHFNPHLHQATLLPLLKHLDKLDQIPEHELLSLLKRYPKNNQGYFSKSQLISGFKAFYQEADFQTLPTTFTAKIKKKPIRTMSGVTPVTILTKPFPCPGKCIFCPNDVRMPKSYLADEPGAQRAARFAFDPYLQTYNRLRAFKSNGHSVDKIELIILGGTWSFYPEPYQIWFITRAFQALNDFGSGVDKRDKVQVGSDFTKPPKTIDGNNISNTYNQLISSELIKTAQKKLLNPWENAAWQDLAAVQKINQTAKCRNVGLVIETRPDYISPAEVVRLRRLGCTKTQIGFQSLNDEVLDLNKRGHDVAATRRAMKLLRQSGLKIHAHWMPNLYGSDPQKDIKDFHRIFSDPDFKPDELKIYPTSLIASAELMQYFKKGLWQPYTHDQLLHVVATCMKATPRYCRLTRVVRDIPGTDIVTGNKKTNFRQIAESEIKNQGKQVVDIRAREIRDTLFDPSQIKLKTTTYNTSTSDEFFLEFVTPEDYILGFLRLSLPSKPSFIPEISTSAIIREVHVYGVAANLGEHHSLKAQHLGLGSKLIKKAENIAQKHGFKDLAVISAIGTREYYQKQGFVQDSLYQHKSLPTS